MGHVFYGGARSGFNPSVPDLVLEPSVSDFALFLNAGLVENFRAYKFSGMGDINGDQRTDFALADGLGGALHAYLGRNPQPAAPPPPGDVSRLPSEPFVFGLATPLQPVVADPQGVTLPRQSPTPIAVDRAFALIGSRSNEQLGQSRSVGDVNGDGFDDLLVSGISANTILLGPVELDTAESVASRANIKVDAASLISPATGHGDLNGDGFDDLVFRSATEQNRLRVVFGGANLPATLAAGGTSILFDQPDPISDVIISVHLLNWDGDRKADMLVRAGDRAYVIAGKDLVIDGELQGHITNVATISRTGTTGFSADAFVAGDVNGDGLDDALFVDAPEPAAAEQKAYLFVGRRPAGGAANLTLEAADATFDIGSFFVPESGVASGRLQTAAVGDLNRDGYDDIALWRTVELDAPGSATLYLFMGSPEFSVSAKRALTGADAAARFTRQQASEFGDTVSVDGILTVTSGDWDGDGELDLAVGEVVRGGIGPGSTVIDIQRRGLVHVFRGIEERLAGAPLTLNLADDDVTLQGEQDVDFFGALAATPSLDIDRDGIDDLLIGAPFAQGLAGKSMSCTDRGRPIRAFSATRLRRSRWRTSRSRAPARSWDGMRSLVRMRRRISTATGSRISCCCPVRTAGSASRRWATARRATSSCLPRPSRQRGRRSCAATTRDSTRPRPPIAAPSSSETRCRWAARPATR